MSENKKLSEKFLEVLQHEGVGVSFSDKEGRPDVAKCRYRLFPNL